MKKTFYKVSNLLLGSVITLLGFSCCRTTRNQEVECVYGPPSTFGLKEQEEEEQLKQWQQQQEEQRLIEEQKEREKRESMIKVVYGPPPSSLIKARPDADGIYDVVEQMPLFDNGRTDPTEWTSSHMRYPAKARQQGVEGRVIVSFIVKADGSLDGISVVRPVHPLLDAEAVRVVKTMPRWESGRHHGEAVSVRYILPVDFKLE